MSLPKLKGRCLSGAYRGQDLDMDTYQIVRKERTSKTGKVISSY